jgi:hypothetical protein
MLLYYVDAGMQYELQSSCESDEALITKLTELAATWARKPTAAAELTRT